jgi:hypothetical protein
MADKDLEKIKSEIELFCKQNDINILHSEKFEEVGARVEFEGKNHQELLLLAKRLNIDVVYLFEFFEEIGQNKILYMIKFGFPHNGVFNFFSETSEQYDNKVIKGNHHKYKIIDERWVDKDKELEIHQKKQNLVDLDYPLMERWEDRDPMKKPEKQVLPKNIKEEKQKWEDHL